MSLLGRAYRTETVEEPNYAFDIDGIFHVPADGDHASYIEHCKVWLDWIPGISEISHRKIDLIWFKTFFY